MLKINFSQLAVGLIKYSPQLVPVKSVIDIRHTDNGIVYTKVNNGVYRHSHLSIIAAFNYNKSKLFNLLSDRVSYRVFGQNFLRRNIKRDHSEINFPIRSK